MTDTFDEKKRSDIMSKVHSKDTKPELIVRRMLHSMGYRFRLHRVDLPGKPDIVLPKYKLAIFVHGCFWHGCSKCSHAQKRPQNNSVYWNRKLDMNIERDRKNEFNLKELGWAVLIIWECETKRKKAKLLADKLRDSIDFLTSCQKHK